ncbi:hypothetical protein NDU88_004438 [Pleurodeles waltl]|uniref:Uncharacterized protein n=1 Tax=Pleurodeles waltl TaxID=8319 RepID=A0AAV7RI59_PLEWA|nr:hypothetical protein NDU88_004438 [Pleurodeles waltl]
MHHRTQQIPRCRWSKVTEDQLNTGLARSLPTEPTDPDLAACNLRRWLDSCTNTLAPLKKPSNRGAAKRASWFTSDRQASKQTCRKLEKKWHHEHTLDRHAAQKNTIRKHHHHLIRSAKRTSFKDRLDNNAHNSKELFNIVKELSNPTFNTNDIPPSQDLCVSLATFFHLKITDTHNCFNNQTTLTTTSTSDSPPTIDYDPLLAWANMNVDYTIKTMSTIHSGSPSDPWPHHIFNKASATIEPCLRKVINISFETATFPESWNHAEINALLEKPKVDPRDLKNF